MVAIANGRTARDLTAQAREINKQQMHQWFEWMDRLLDIHRSNFVFRVPASEELEEHKFVIKSAIQKCLFINALISDPDFNDPDLVSRLQVRVRQLQDAYD